MQYPPERAADHRIVDRRTHDSAPSTERLSAALPPSIIRWSAVLTEASGSISVVSAHDKHCVTDDNQVVVGRRLLSTIELACTGVAHKARAALSGLSGQRGMAAGAAFAYLSSGRRSGPSDLFAPPVTQMYHTLYSRNQPTPLPP